jgi:DNA-binding transcriptional ArsR family regulator
MAIADFLGETAEIRIVDFLAENNDQSYNITEIASCVGLSRTTVYQKIPKLIYNRIVKVSETIGKSKRFQIEDNDIVQGLMNSAISNSFLVGTKNLEEKEKIKQIFKEIELPELEKNRFSSETLTFGEDVILIKQPPVIFSNTFEAESTTNMTLENNTSQLEKITFQTLQVGQRVSSND